MNKLSFSMIHEWREKHLTELMEDWNLALELDGEVFEPLQNPEFFSKFHIDPEMKTIAWDNGAYFALEFLFEKLRIPLDAG